MSLCGETTKDHYREEHRDGQQTAVTVTADDRVTRAADTGDLFAEFMEL